MKKIMFYVLTTLILFNITELKKIFVILFSSLLLTNNLSANNDSYNSNTKRINQNSFDWVIDRIHIQPSRGGTTLGIEVEYDKNSSTYFQELMLSENKKEKDRLAILSLQGEYKVSFEFTELYGAETNYKLDSPYKSWGTEIVIALENTEDFISLQHIMAMYVKNKNGDVEGPYVQKHWRQDWKYEDKEILNYKSDKNWDVILNQDNSGTWSQTVYQVDDTPRYESFGKWKHQKGASQWISEKTPRPLPRREFSVRSDYELLNGVNKITVMSWGWVMEELNDKLASQNIFIGSEFGIARYQKIRDFNFKPAYQYWDDTGEYWKTVRSEWNNYMQINKKICMNNYIDNQPSYSHYFKLAEEYKKSKDINDSKKKVAYITKKFLKKCN